MYPAVRMHGKIERLTDRQCLLLVADREANRQARLEVLWEPGPCGGTDGGELCGPLLFDTRHETICGLLLPSQPNGMLAGDR